MLYCLQKDWRNRSRGFLLDWAEAEPDDDLTKNYPFPVPRIRDLPDEFRTECCSLHSCRTSPTKEKSQNSANTEGTISCNPATQPLITVEGPADDSSHTSSDEFTEGRRGIVHYPKRNGHVKPPHHSNARSSFHTYAPRRYHGSARFRSLRQRKTSAKSIVEEPPDASAEDIAKARHKLLQIREVYVHKLFN